MATKFFAQGVGAFYIQKSSPSAESGYIYYMRVHPTGRILMVKANEANTDFLYADGGTDKDYAWTHRADFDYTSIDEI